MSGIFDKSVFNADVFAAYTLTVPRTKRNELLRAGVLRTRPDLAAMFPEQAGGNYVVIPMFGRLTGTPDKYDGQTDITATSIDSYSQGMVAHGAAKAFTEKDFLTSITGADFMPQIASQIVNYWDDYRQAVLLAALKGIFSTTDALSQTFVTKHTYNATLSTASPDPINPNLNPKAVNATTLNSAIQQASGDNKNIYTVAIMHSAVATNLENLNLLKYVLYNDANGMISNTNIGQWNGRTVFVDDSMPFNGTNYTTYILGAGAFDYADLPVKVPFEPYRDPKTAGGQDYLYSRNRELLSPYGFHFTKAAMATLSPDISELEMGANWQVVHNVDNTMAFDHKAIPIVRIISEG